MELILVLILPVVLGFREDYKGFDECGEGGWHCEPDQAGVGLVVTYECSYGQSARIWAWTARVPRYTSSLVVKNCRHVEVHLDCTTGYRSYNMKSFKVINVEHLEFLQPIPPFIFLHDNAQIPLAPPEIHLESVKNISWYPGIFDKAGGRCRYKSTLLEKLTMIDVNIEELQENIFNGMHDISLSLTKTNIGTIHGNSIVLTGPLEIKDSNLGNIPKNGIKVTGSKVIIENTIFKEIKESGFHLRTSHFEFSNNTIDNCLPKSLNVLAFNTTIADNYWVYLHKDAFRMIGPGLRREDPKENEEHAHKTTFMFVNNRILSMEYDSMDPNYMSYERVCSEFIITNNELPCSCEPMWAAPNQNFHHRAYYDLLTEAGSNACKNIPNCTLQMALTVAKNENCSHPNNVFSEMCKPDLINVVDATEEYITETINFETEKSDSGYTTKAPDSGIPDASYLTPSGASSKTVAAIVVPLVIVAIATTSFLIYWFYFKKKRSEIVMKTAYQNHWRSDYEEETLIDDGPVIGLTVETSGNPILLED